MKRRGVHGQHRTVIEDTDAVPAYLLVLRVHSDVNVEGIALRTILKHGSVSTAQIHVQRTRVKVDVHVLGHTRSSSAAYWKFCHGGDRDACILGSVFVQCHPSHTRHRQDTAIRRSEVEQIRQGNLVEHLWGTLRLIRAMCVVGEGNIDRVVLYAARHTLGRVFPSYTAGEVLPVSSYYVWEIQPALLSHVLSQARSPCQTHYVMYEVRRAPRAKPTTSCTK